MKIKAKKRFAKSEKQMADKLIDSKLPLFMSTTPGRESKINREKSENKNWIIRKRFLLPVSMV